MSINHRINSVMSSRLADNVNHKTRFTTQTNDSEDVLWDNSMYHSSHRCSDNDITLGQSRMYVRGYGNVFGYEIYYKLGGYRSDRCYDSMEEAITACEGMAVTLGVLEIVT